MSIPPLFLGRLQFIGSLAFVALFMALALALSWLLLYFKLRARTSGDAGWTSAYRFWVRIFALAFILALACGVPVLLQLGTVWSGLMDKIGNVAGPLVGFAVLSVFALKSCFLGVMLFGQRRVSEIVHTLSVLMVALGHLATVFWVLALVSWAQTPDGAVAVDGRFQIYDWARVVFNPALGWMLGSTVLGALLTAAFLIMGITAWQALRRPLDDGERLGFRAALGLACIAAALLAPVGAGMGKLIAHYQPAKAAAAAPYWHEGDPPDLVVLGWPDADSATSHGVWTLKDAAARWLGRNVNGHFLALENYANMQPPVALTFWSLRGVAILAILMTCAAWATLLKLRKRGFDPSFLSRRWLRALALMTFSGAAFVAVGWIFTAVGIQPYAVNGAVTQSEILGTASPRALLYGTLGYAVLYGVLGTAFVRMLFHAARYGVVPVRRMAGVAS
ncbi:cytochrome ubiquinol oxidase subunit I [Bordetella genomosp. 11]|uniref:Cytochrome ubiquinol oxidase subunit I n=1 Tax=Bordetella genomosp. 11 TaxID=1416808 RepID=A0A261V0Q9_9BORD|nr:cytochrome ubiquinol oxidase subunit I [Bordetella genomosp. 11]OZI67182.1 cytochrome ubiquinol oxidase subunit I [Bordetella genomosp. 11]